MLNFSPELRSGQGKCLFVVKGPLFRASFQRCGLRWYWLVCGSRLAVGRGDNPTELMNTSTIPGAQKMACRKTPFWPSCRLATAICGLAPRRAWYVLTEINLRYSAKGTPAPSNTTTFARSYRIGKAHYGLAVSGAGSSNTTM